MDKFKPTIVLLACLSLASAQWFSTLTSEEDDPNPLSTQKRTVHARFYSRIISGLSSPQRTFRRNRNMRYVQILADPTAGGGDGDGQP